MPSRTGLRSIRLEKISFVNDDFLPATRLQRLLDSQGANSSRCQQELRDRRHLLDQLAIVCHPECPKRFFLASDQILMSLQTSDNQTIRLHQPLWSPRGPVLRVFPPGSGFVIARSARVSPVSWKLVVDWNLNGPNELIDPRLIITNRVFGHHRPIQQLLAAVHRSQNFFRAFFPTCPTEVALPASTASNCLRITGRRVTAGSLARAPRLAKERSDWGLG